MRPSLRRSLLLSLLMCTIACRASGNSGSDAPGAASDSTSAVENPGTVTQAPPTTDPAAPVLVEEPPLPVEEVPAPTPTVEPDPTTPTTVPAPLELPAVCAPLTGLPSLQGALTTWLQTVSISAPRSEGYREPSGPELAAFEGAFRALLASGPSPERVSEFAQLGYSLSAFFQTNGHPWLVLVDLVPGRGGGTFVINLAPARDVWLETPHADSDEGTLRQGASNLVALGARALLITGASRCATTVTSACSGTTRVCGTQGLRRSDAAHNANTFFTSAHRALRDTYPDGVAVSLHGMEAPSDEAAVISDGTEVDRAGAFSIQFRNALNHHLPPTTVRRAFSCNSPKDTGKHSDLCGTSNIQGRIDNGVPDACLTDALSATDRFLHLEQSASLRGIGPSGDAVTRALADTLPCALPGTGLGCPATAASVACR